MKKNIALIVMLSVKALEATVGVCDDGFSYGYEERVSGRPIVNIAKSYKLHLSGVEQADQTILPLQAKYVIFPNCDFIEQDIEVEAFDAKTGTRVPGPKVKILANPASTKKQKTNIKTGQSVYGYEVQVGYLATGVSFKKPTIRVTPLTEKQYKAKKYPILRTPHQVAAIKEQPSSSATSASATGTR